MSDKRYVFGIDLGTTYSCISYVDDTGRATVVNNGEGNNVTPSVVFFESPENVVVGDIAKENAVMEPDKTVAFVKTLIGKSDFAINYNDRDYTPEEISALILKKLCNDAQDQLGTEVKDVVITCPAYFGTAERTATKNAGEIAGLNVIDIISEPTAAAIYYGCTKSEEAKTILVYDLGGGTFDVTVMRVEGSKITVVCSDGNHELGGKNWDDALMNYLMDEFKAETDYDGEFDLADLQDLRGKVEKTKMRLTQKTESPIVVDCAGIRKNMTVTRDLFESLTDTLLRETIDKTNAAIEVAKQKGFEIDDIILVGGSTRMPQVTRILKDTYGKDPKILEPDEAVSKGASIYALDRAVVENSESGEEVIDDVTAEQKEDIEQRKKLAIGGKGGATEDKNIEIVFATTKSYGIKAYINGELKCCNLIKKNEPMEGGKAESEQEFGTLEANQQTVELEIFEADNMDDFYEVDEDKKLGNATLELPGNQPAGSPIGVNFILMNNGTLTVTGTDKMTGKQIQVTLQVDGIMSEEKLEEAKSHATSLVVK